MYGMDRKADTGANTIGPQDLGQDHRTTGPRIGPRNHKHEAEIMEPQVGGQENKTIGPQDRGKDRKAGARAKTIGPQD
ncbi:hypothetical protein J6590_057381 [Homalodisca vitripennis]|nr:hypothetical protein J6590_057381 [Homalodisca vitripennis]